MFEDVSGAAYGGHGWFMQVGGGAVNVTVDHNTVLQDGTSALYAYGEPMINFVFTNNIVPDHSWAVMGADASPGSGTIAVYYPLGRFSANVFAGSPSWIYPLGNHFPASMSGVGFADLSGGHYRLSAASAYRSAATDGTDVGCNIDALNAAIAPRP